MSFRISRRQFLTHTGAGAAVGVGITSGLLPVQAAPAKWESTR